MGTRSVLPIQLEFKLKVPGEDLTKQRDAKIERYISLLLAKARRGRTADMQAKRRQISKSSLDALVY